MHKLEVFRNWITWSGCGKDIDSEKYSNYNLLINDEQNIRVLNDLYTNAFKKAMVTEPI